MAKQQFQLQQNGLILYKPQIIPVHYEDLKVIMSTK